MSAAAVSKRGPVERKRRVHAKSKNGCGNCKLRRVKCDEAHPACRKCKLYGVSCDYTGSKSSLDLSAQGSFQVDFAPPSDSLSDGVPSQKRVDTPNPSPYYDGADLRSWSDKSFRAVSPISLNVTMATMINDSLQANLDSEAVQPSSGLGSLFAIPFWSFGESHLEIMARFHDRTSLTIGNKSMAYVYREIICKLSFSHAFLMYMLLSITVMHDAELSLAHSPALAARQKHEALRIWNTATRLFNRILAQPIPNSYRDAIWATGVILGAASFWYIESTDITQVWPLKPAESNDMSWMKLGEGKRHLWRLAEPTRPDSLFHCVLKERPCSRLPDWMLANDISMIPPRVRAVYGITPQSTIANNMYQLPLLILSQVRNLRLTHDNALKFLYITAFITADFLALLEAKDPHAVFVLGWWYMMIQDGELWWMARRAKVEGEAVMVWLQRGHPELADLLEDLVKERSKGDGSSVLDLPEFSWGNSWKSMISTIEVN